MGTGRGTASRIRGSVQARGASRRVPVLARTIQIRGGACIGRGALMRVAAARGGKGRGGAGAARAGGLCCLWLLPLGRACLGWGNVGAGRSPVIVPVRRR